jgi:hypothetical protein
MSLKMVLPMATVITTLNIIWQSHGGLEFDSFGAKE